MTRGILYIVWGNYNKAELQRSIDSVVKFGYDYHVAEIEDEGIGLAHKAKMYDLSPFDTTLFLDTDTVVMDNLDYGFYKAEKHGIACCIAPASSAYLAAKEIGMPLLNNDTPQYNTGVIFFTKYHTYYDYHDKHYDNHSLFENFRWCVHRWPQSLKNDQPALARSIEMGDVNPYILPRTWNYRAKMRYEAKVTHGPIKILHAR